MATPIMPESLSYANAINTVSSTVQVITDSDRPRPGYVYLIESRCKSLTKIGRSIDPSSRIAAISNMSGGVGKVYVGCMVKDHVAIESALHLLYSEYRTRGEWFSVEFSYLVQVLKQVCDLFAATDADIAQKKEFDANKSIRIIQAIQDKLLNGAEAAPKNIIELKIAIRLAPLLVALANSDSVWGDDANIIVNSIIKDATGVDLLESLVEDADAL